MRVTKKEKGIVNTHKIRKRESKYTIMKSINSQKKTVRKKRTKELKIS